MKLLRLAVSVFFISELFAVQFFPFGESNGDELAPKGDDLSFGPISLSPVFKFYGVLHSRLYVNSNGVLSFDSKFDSTNASLFQHVNLTLLAPFWSDVDTEVGGKIYYRVVADSVLFDSLSNELRSVVASASKLRIMWAFVVTWFQVPAYFGHRSVNNTFQVVIATDGQYSFVVLNYGTLMWPVKSGNAVAGFHNRDQKSTFHLPGSYTLDIVKLSQTSNVNIPGKWIYRIDSVDILEPKAECIVSTRLELSPTAVFFIGGDHVLVRNLCLKFSDEVKISLDGAARTRCFILNSTSCYFEVPFLKKIGKVKASLSVNGDPVSSGFLLSKDVPLREEIQGLSYFYPSAGSLDYTLVKWIPDTDAPSKNNASFSVAYVYVDDSNAMQSHSFTLHANANPSGTVVNLKHILQADAASALVRRKRSLTHEIEFSFIGIYRETRVTSDTLIKSWVTMSPIFVNSDSLAGASLKCQEWNGTESKVEYNKRDVSSCWPFLSLDPVTGNFPLEFGNFMQYWFCNPYRPELCKLLHPGAVVCYKTVAAEEYSDYGNVCCYSKDNRLLVGPRGGGSLASVHPNNPLEHFYSDLRPLFACCVLSDNCLVYYLNRPSDNGEYMSSFSVAAVTGDPHFYRFDGVSFTFNGYGEYSILSIPEFHFEIQIRLVPYGAGTVVSALVIRNALKNRIQIEQSKELVLVIDEIPFNLRNGQSVQFDEFFIRFASNTFRIHFWNGISVQVKSSEKRNALTVMISVPDALEIYGMLKAMQTSNVFMLPNKTEITLAAVSNDKEVFYKYGTYWRINENTSAFSYPVGVTTFTFTNKSYVPNFIEDGVKFTNSTLETNANRICGENKQCLFDISVTSDPIIGLMTLECEKELAERKLFFQKVSKSCLPLGSYFLGGKISTMFADKDSENTVLRFTCEVGYCLRGQSEIRCQNGAYDQPVPTCTPCNTSTTLQTSIIPSTLVTLLSIAKKKDRILN